MGADDQYDLKSMNVSDQVSQPRDGPIDNFPTELEKQTRTRRLFSTAQLFAFSIMYLMTWGSVGSNMYFALFNGGPTAWFFGYFIVVSGVLAQAASFAEMASILPVAGAHIKRFLTWLQGWSTWTAYVAITGSILNANAVIFEGLIAMNYPSYEPGGWRTTLQILANLAFCVFINMFAFRVVPWFEMLAGILNVCLFVIYIVVLWVMSPRNSADIFWQTNVSSGYKDYFIAANVGSLSHIFLFIAFEGVIHMSEETRNAHRAVPCAMFWSMFTNFWIGLVMLVTLMICMPDVETVLNGPSPFVTVLLHATRSTKAATAMVAGLMVMAISCNMSSISSTSRLTWAWARDGGLPKWFGHVDGKHRVPLRALALTSIITIALSLLFSP
ncbi:amino acid/polyamine transporter I [Pseudomassariella vexata]|uniref:Amino acid/polyamine transporter I n=1 Tax=Pseudomassariella vexata TaxID=1141098 RepID=A0A1Y2E6P3_9PEZI|nr:amino acid/polyamine transporter I [Pseudomassariella vexata]ORY66535.1 amino acid/polyamine transporter I [Pseudomassariella vexata]